MADFIYTPSFNDPRFHMTVGGRLLVRLVNSISSLVFLALTVVLLLQREGWQLWVGMFMAIFLTDRLVHLKEADRPMDELPNGGEVNAAEYVSPRAFRVVERAFDRSALKKSDLSLEAAKELIRLPEINEGLARLDISVGEFRDKLDEFVQESEVKRLMSADERGKALEQLVIGSFSKALANRHRFIEPADIFSALGATQQPALVRLFSMFSVEADDLSRAMLFGTLKRGFSFWQRLPRALSGFVFPSERQMQHRIMNRAWTARPTPNLDRYASDFTDLAREEQIGFLIGHEEEYKRLVETLSRPGNPNAMLVGEAGIGKEALVGHLAFELVHDRVPNALFDKRLVALNISSLVAGASAEELQERLKEIIHEIGIAGNIILYIPDIHNLVKTSGTAYLSAADAFVPIIMNNAFPVVGSTYPQEFKQYIEPRSDFASAFEIIRVEEVSPAEAEQILIYDSMLLEAQRKMIVSFGAIKTAVALAKKYFHNKFLPSSAEDLLKNAVADAEQRGEKTVGVEDVIRAAEEKSKIPIHAASGMEAETLLNLEKVIHDRFVDQEEAVKAVANALREYRSGLARKGGPIASFLFVGPTGVGKTELSKLLTKLMFGSPDLMVRFDMTEYQDKQSFYRFIGSPDGQIRGALTDAVLAKPYSLVLLDEFEKAYPDILNLFLQVLDDARLTDNMGRTVDFQNTIIIATSNAHSDIVNDALSQGETMDQISDYLKKKLVDVFKPELLNRFSKIVVFKNLEPKELEVIAAINLKDFADSMLEQGITISFDDTAVKQIAHLGYDPAFGARPIRRTIDERIRASLAEKILKNEVVRGSSVVVSFSGTDFVFTPKA